MTGVVTTLTGADGSGLTGITTLISAGSNITVTTNAGITTISSTGGGVGVGTTTVSTNSLVVSGVSTLGVVTGATYYGDASYITHSKWDLNADGTSHYLFTGPAGLSSTADPVIYLARGQNYEFVNNMGAHPFEIRSSNGGSAFLFKVISNKFFFFRIAIVRQRTPAFCINNICISIAIIYIMCDFKFRII